MLYTRFHAIRKRWLLVRMAVIAAVLAAPLNGQQPAGSVTQDPSATSEPKQNPTMSSSPNNPVAHLKQEDFQLFDQGKLQPISLFTRKARREQTEAATKTRVVEFIAWMFDDSHISLDDATCFRQVVPGFLDEIIPN